MLKKKIKKYLLIGGFSFFFICEGIYIYNLEPPVTVSVPLHSGNPGGTSINFFRFFISEWFMPDFANYMPDQPN